MDNDLRLIGAAWKWGRPVLSIAAFLATIAATTSTYIQGLRFHEILLYGAWTLLLTSCCVWVLLNVGDRLIGWSERFKEGRRVARLLTEWGSVSNPAIRIDALVGIWMEKTPDNKIIRKIRENTLLRTLKSAVRQGLILRYVEDHSEVTAITLCDVESAADFFAKRKWIDVKPEPDIPESTQVPAGMTVNPTIRVRQNWIRGWRDSSDPWL